MDELSGQFSPNLTRVYFCIEYYVYAKFQLNGSRKAFNLKILPPISPLLLNQSPQNFLQFLSIQITIYNYLYTKSEPYPINRGLYTVVAKHYQKLLRTEILYIIIYVCK